MRDANGLLPLVLAALVLGGFASLPRSAGPVTSRGADEKAAVSGVGTQPPARTEIELVADYFAVDVNRLAYLRAVACADEVVKKASKVQQEQVRRLLTAAGGTAPADLSTRIAVELTLAGANPSGCHRPPDDVLRDYLSDRRERVQLEVLNERIAGAKIEFVVAIVPDPVESNGRWQFDPLVDALQRAVAESGYVLDRFTLPDADPGVNPDRRATFTRHEREPGAILFRHVPSAEDLQDSRFAPVRQNELLLVFLVYEMATGGVHQEALGHAIATSSDWQKLQGFTEPVRVLGPTYSGSIASIRRVLAEQVGRDSTLELRIVSGGATALDNQPMITSLAPERVSYHATLLPDDVMLETVADRLPPLHARSRRGQHVPAVQRASALDHGRGTAPAVRVDDGSGRLQCDARAAQLRQERQAARPRA